MAVVLFTEPAVLKEGFCHRLVDLHHMLGRFSVPLDFSGAVEDFAAEGALPSNLQLFHHLRYRFIGRGHRAALSAVHTAMRRTNRFHTTSVCFTK